MPKRARPQRSGRLILFLIWAPTVIGGLWIGAVADKWLPGTIAGAVIGFVIGIALASFPDLDRGGPADGDDPFG